jgi:4-hydroxy-tetrahydrodipicolinate reductase
MRILLVGHGRMGRLVESLAASHGCDVAGIVTAHSGGAASISNGDFGAIDVAIDFSTPSAVPDNLPVLIKSGFNVVVGTTGWRDQDGSLRAAAVAAGVGVLVSANFAIGMSIFTRAVEDAARRFATQPDAGAWIHEAHHSAKKDAPSGTALMLKAAMEHAGYGRPIDVSSTRAGSIPGTHTVGFDAQAETITLTHAVRDRAVFAHGALAAANWIQGRSGWFTIDDMINSGTKFGH